MSFAFLRLKKAVPVPVKSFLKTLGFGRVLPLLKDKYYEELEFQIDWAEEFVDNVPQVLQYWRQYRCLDDINKICEFNDHTKVLDVGCGISTVLHFVPGKRYGIDPLAEKYKKVYQYPAGVEIQEGFGEDIPFEDEYFDVIFCSNAIDHMSDPIRSMQEIYRVLAPSGKFVFTVEVFSHKVERNLAHPHTLTKEDVYKLLEGRFNIIFEKESVWVGVSHYVHGSRRGDNIEMITVSEKIVS